MSEESSAQALPTGTWLLDPENTRLGFSARGAFGLATVKGKFDRCEGDLVVDPAGRAAGQLRIAAASLDTGNKRRDAHLRSADFFDAEHHPTVIFDLLSVDSAITGHPELTGDLKIGESSLRVTAPLEVDPSSPDTLRLRTQLSVDRAAAGVGWSRMGMVKGRAELDASVALMRGA